jgi:hypothetical protein
MDQNPIVQVVERIEAALSRVEKASRDAAGLRERHDGLKASVARSIEDIDRLLSGATQ